MSQQAFRHAVGIDLGTTHCALSYSAPRHGAAGSGAAGSDASTSRGTPPVSLLIPQLVAPGEVSPKALLPSFLYLPAEGEFAANALNLPWSSEGNDAVGEFARSKGATTPGRLVSSAKSWLSHAGVDRQSALLPLSAAEGTSKVSPVQASARYLSHLKSAWDLAHPEFPLHEQEIVLTVPASFDAVARELTLEAAAQAGFLTPPRLLEEPQAALYDWVAQSGGAWREQVRVGDRILVVDIGGGTTDFSLISVSENGGQLELERIAVGDHILLGGDNMDLALAFAVRARLEAAGKKLDDWQFQALVYSCRVAKEALLVDEPPAEYPLVIPGRGSKLIGGTIRTELALEELQRVLLDGFFPEVPGDAKPQQARRSGLTTMGLPYASDAAVTRHLAAFLARASVKAAEAKTHPAAVLFNGGVTRSPVVKGRLLKLLADWAAEDGAAAPRALTGTDAELAVSRGAAYYAQARVEGGLRIRGGTAQTHYIGIERAELAVPGIPPRLDAVCVAPFGMEEGAAVTLEQSFGLVLGESVSFQFFASATRRDDALGCAVAPEELTELAPLETMLDGESGETVQVRLRAAVTEVGTLELSAVELSEARSWKLSFNIRGD